MLNDQQKRRYARQISLPQIGEAGQEKLKAARILVVGAGGLGAASLSYLAASGIGKIGIIDGDYVELSNLNRQIIHETGDIGRLKVQSAADRISELNPEIELQLYSHNLTNDNADLVAGYDLLIDGCDNFQTRYVINQAALRYEIPWIYGAAQGFSGQVATFYATSDAPCYRCFVPQEPRTINDCASRGILGAVVGVVGATQAVEAIKCLLSLTQPQTNIMRYDGLRAQWRSSRLLKDETCKICAKVI